MNMKLTSALASSAAALITFSGAATAHVVSTNAARIVRSLLLSRWTPTLGKYLENVSRSLFIYVFLLLFFAVRCFFHVLSISSTFSFLSFLSPPLP